MAINKQQYNEILRKYERRREENASISERRLEEVHAKIPGYSLLEQEVVDLSTQCSRAMINASSPAEAASFSSSLKQKLIRLTSGKKDLLRQAGFPEDYLEPVYTCSKCHDTGYTDNEKCSCFRDMELEYLYEETRIRDILKENNFSFLSYDYYQDDELRMFREAVTTSYNFIDNFSTDYQNILFYGPVGCGKSFLSSCIAKELLDRGHSVLYFSSSLLFQNISSVYFSADKAPLTDLYDTLYNTDLLIIDDLGTEFANEFVRSQLFLLLNERILRKKSIIISTNLTLEDLRTIYSDRFFSRLVGICKIHRLSCKDIRIQKKLEQETKAGS